MKLKKQVKVVIVLIILGGIGFGFYSFNQWFFTKYKTKDTNVEEKNEGTSQEVRENEETINKTTLPSNNENKEETTEKNTQQSSISNSVFPIEEKYCNEPYYLSGDKCIAKFETQPITRNVSDGTEIYAIDIPFTFTDITEGFQIKEECEKEGGKFNFEYNSDDTEGICTIYVDLSTREESTCLDGYTLKNGVCIKEISQDASIRKRCPKGYTLDGVLCKK